MTGRPAVVAAGHAEVCRAAASVLEAGGNAFDAAIAAGFAAAVAEPVFTSLGGGGFLLARTAAGDEVLFDFFVDTPGLGLDGAAREPHFLPVTITFPASTQIFNVGLGSAAVPGALPGYLHVHRRLGRLPLADVLAPATSLAEQGVVLTPLQARLNTMVEAILTLSDSGRTIYAPRGRLLGEGERVVNGELVAFLGALAADGRPAGFHAGPLAEQVAADMAAGGGLVTAADLAAYGVVERTPLEIRYRGRRLLTNPPPSFGGSLIALALHVLEERAPRGAEWGSPDQMTALVEAMVQVEDDRAAGRVDAHLRATRGTTHVSVDDGDGNVASMTTSNGEGCGYFVPGTGVMLNNMLGEDDLHPDGFHAAAPGQRVASMMAPTLLFSDDSDDKVAMALGSGGSKRIRTALLQVISAVVDHHLEVSDAVEAPRLHWDGEHVQAEPGLPSDALAALAGRWPVNEWPDRDLYFGGVHAVVPGIGGAGDPRRGGDAAIVYS